MGREVRRVPLDFDWPIRQTWEGFLNPYYRFRSNCSECNGSGYSPEATRLAGQWYGRAEFDPVEYGAEPLTIDHPGVQEFAERNVSSDPAFYLPYHCTGSRDEAVKREARRLFGHWQRQWEHHLIQADVDALITGGRLYVFTHRIVEGEGWQPIEPAPVVTAEQVNAWSLNGMGHDAINQSVCVRARCEREGVTVYCKACEGHGDKWPSKAHKGLYEAWKDIEPPDGDGWQMWEDVSEGSPISPVFATPEQLARWLTDAGESDTTYEAWLNMINAGWAPSAIADEHGFRSGVAAMADAQSSGLAPMLAFLSLVLFLCVFFAVLIAHADREIEQTLRAIAESDRRIDRDRQQLLTLSPFAAALAGGDA